jgi:glycosyltransferase involved in cell wall biosynthesis
MAVHNAAKSLPRALDSVRAQTLEDFEFVVVDDGSTDDTRRILTDAAASDSRIRLLFNTLNAGLAVSLNRGCEAVRGDIIARMDADDECLPDRLAAQVAWMTKYPEVDVLGTAIYVRDRHGVSRGVAQRPCSHAQLVAQIRGRVPFYHPTVVMKRSFIQRAEGYNPVLRKAQDADLWLRTYRWAVFANLAEPKLYYTRTDPSWRAIWGAAMVKGRAGLRYRDPIFFYYAFRSICAAGLGKIARRPPKL